MIQVRDVSLSFGSQTIFDDVSLSIQSQQRIGIVGRNGMGKSTLLKIIAGQQFPDSGHVDIERHKKIAYMPQELVLLSSKTVFDEAFSVFDAFVKLKDEMANLESRLENGDPDAETLLERYTDIQNQLKDFDFSAARARTERILFGLGFDELFQKKLVSQLSVGWKMRLVLAKLLLLDADFYLFDEPTNHLDLSAKEWFYNFLRMGRSGFLLVSHDRFFLDNLCDHIFELDRGKGTLFSGNFTRYLDQKERRKEITEKTYLRQQKEIAQKMATIERFKASASKAKMAKSMIKQIERIELVEPEEILPNIKFSFPETVRSGAIVLSFKNLKKSFNEHPVFTNIDGEIKRGERVAIVAPNGTGKTTLFNLITGKYNSEGNGEIKFGHNVNTAIFEQDQLSILNPKNTIYQEILDACPNTSEQVIRTFLGSFLFSGDDIFKKIQMLSGGERSRVAMIKVLLQNANFLLLDEPTNHLDLYSKDVLLQALLQFQGTILFVSHDRDFVDKLATRILELTPNKLISYPGSYESYLYQKNIESGAQVNNSIKISKTIDKESVGKDAYLIKKELLSVESVIEKIEKEIAKINEQFGDYEYGTDGYQKNVDNLKDKQKKLKDSMLKWEELQKKLDVHNN